MKCFFCDGGLCNWDVEDEPWTEHARWFPDCGFVKQVKGMSYIHKVRENGVNNGDSVHKNSSHASEGNNVGSSKKGLTMTQKREVRAAMKSPCVMKVGTITCNC